MDRPGDRRIKIENVEAAYLARYGLRTRAVAGLGEMASDATGRFFLVEANRRAESRLPAFLRTCGFAFAGEDHLEHTSWEARRLARRTSASKLDYLILIPTLRCNLSCSYCQVSRAPLSASGFDWSEDVVARIETMIDGLVTDQIKIEFQGGEPTLRLDLIERIIQRCDRFSEKRFVICSNLARVDEALLKLLERDDVSISTSLDGNWQTHQAQRTGEIEETSRVRQNLERIRARFGPGKVSALPTVNQASPPDPDELIDAYVAQGLASIFLRPINFQGFARKRHPTAKEDHSAWWTYHEAFVMRLIERNFADRSRVLEESYLSLCLRRIFRPGLDRHVDLRNPNPIGVDYLVIDHDGAFYPTDEARMLTRSGVVDLAIGHVMTGMDEGKRQLLDSHSTSFGDPACDKCAYQPYCGRDVVDDLSRYGRIDLPREDTFFCQKHLAMFDLAMRLIHSDDEATQYSLAKWLGLAGDRLPTLLKFS